MKNSLIQLRSKVSRRILLTVLLCTLLPIAGLVTLTLYNVQSRLATDTASRLHHASKNIGMAIMAELQSFSSELERIAAFQEIAPSSVVVIEKNSVETIETPFDAIWLFSDHGQNVEALPPLTDHIRTRLASGQAHLSIIRDQQQISVLLWMPVVDIHNVNGVAVGKLNPEYLWTYAQGFLPPNARLTIVDEKSKPLLHGAAEILDQSSLRYITEATKGYAEIAYEGEKWLVGRWKLFLLAGFDSPGWNILVSEPKAHAFAGLVAFQRNAGLTAIATFWIILLASSILIRKTLHPLQQLKEATSQVAQGNFDFQMNIKSHDEFEMLSDSFNGMVSKIHQQMDRQKNMGTAVRKILGSGQQEDIIFNFFNGLSKIISLDVVRLTLFKCNSTGSEKTGSTWKSQLQGHVQMDIEWGTEVNRAEVESLLADRGGFSYATFADYPVALKPLATLKAQHHFLFHININQKIEAILTLADSAHIAEEESIANVRQLADQLGVALSRAETVEELDALNIGILTALARTVDANSKWTHGHSERVTECALLIARELGFSASDCEDLHRAGLLHDLGKVSIPAEILNKPGKLTDEEFALIQTHPGEAERIIEPIHVFANIRPIVRQHHERWDGKGYPDGLKGEEIHPAARILAVADVYDALYSDRPYRDGWPHEKVLNYLKLEAGSAFDPVAVKGLIRSIQKKAV